METIEQNFEERIEKLSNVLNIGSNAIPLAPDWRNLDRVPDTTDKEKQSSDILKVGEANQGELLPRSQPSLQDQAHELLIWEKEIVTSSQVLVLSLPFLLLILNH